MRIITKQILNMNGTETSSSTKDISRDSTVGTLHLTSVSDVRADDSVLHDGLNEEESDKQRNIKKRQLVMKF